MSIASKGLVLAMEDDSEINGGGDDFETQAEANSASDEIETSVSDVVDLTTGIDNAEGDAEALGRIQETMERSVEEGEGLDETAAEIAEIAVEHICARLGITGKQVMPSMESFGSQHSRLSATRIAIESIGDTIERVWKAIKAALAQLWSKIKQFAVSLFNNAKAIESHLEKLQERVKNLDAAGKKDKNELDNKSLARAFSVAKSANMASFETIEKNTLELLAQAPGLSKVMMDHAQMANNLVNNGQMGEASVTARLATAVAGGMHKIKTVAGIGGSVGTKNKIEYFGPFAYSKVIAVETPDSGEITGFKYKVEAYEEIQATTISALNKAEMGTVLTKALTVVKKFRDYEKEIKSLEAVNKAQEKLANTVISESKKIADDNKNEAASKVYKDAEKTSQAISKMSASLGVEIPGLVLGFGKAAGDWVIASIGNWEVEK